MPTYKVKAYLTTGESISFISRNLDQEDNPLPDLKKNEYLYFNYKDHKEILQLLIDHRKWHMPSIEDAWEQELIVNFTVHHRYKIDQAFIGLTRDEGQTLAIGRGVSFRVVFDNGIADDWDGGYDESRVNVYLDQNIIYNAELY